MNVYFKVKNRGDLNNSGYWMGFAPFYRGFSNKTSVNTGDTVGFAIIQNIYYLY